MIDEANFLKAVPTVALRGLVAFPGMMLHFDVGREKSVAAINTAMAGSRNIFLVAQGDIRVEKPTRDDLYEIGCFAKIRQVLKISDTDVRVLVEGVQRAQLLNLHEGNSFYRSDIAIVSEEPINRRGVYVEALVRKIKDAFDRYASLGAKISPDIGLAVAAENKLLFLCDYIAMNIPAPVDDKQFILEQLNPVKRAKAIIELLGKESEVITIDSRIESQVRQSLDEHQREYYMREQIKAINNELYGDDEGDEIDEYRAKVESLNAPDDIKDKLYTEINKLLKMPQGSHEATVVRNFLDTCIALPWNACTKVSNDINRSKRILDRDFYGMENVKDRILEMLCVYNLVPEIKGQIICLVGPPGVGKTSIAKTIAECMGRRFARVSLGGVSDEAEIRGHRKTYIGAMPGKIINAIKQAGSSNALILLDEIDKLGRDYKGDPSAALLEVLDGEQNSTFTDHYIDMPYDLSKVVFITTANVTDTIPAPLYDRLEIIELSSYTRDEKFNIAKEHLLKRQLKTHGLNGRTCKITDDALYCLIDSYTRESGVRRLERTIATLCRKAAKLLVQDGVAKVTVDAKSIEELLGPKKYRPDYISEQDEVGLINGLAWTSVGGEIMQLEVGVMPGTGKVELTGSLGDVMKESAHAAVTYVRSNAEKWGIDADFYKTCDIHIHATEAAVPKDGPSAGVAITTALVSALTDKKIRRDIAMTGEITIRGRVLPIGGLKEKSMAAHRGGVKTVFIPKDNASNLVDVDDTVLEAVEFIPVERVDEILNRAFVTETDTRIEETTITHNPVAFTGSTSTVRASQ